MFNGIYKFVCCRMYHRFFLPCDYCQCSHQVAHVVFYKLVCSIENTNALSLFVI